MTAPLLHKILSPAECFEVSALLEAKYLALRALPAPESSSARVAREAAEAYERECEPAPDTQRTGEEPVVGPDWLEQFGVKPEVAAAIRAKHREAPVYRGGVDHEDDKSDIQPFERTSTFPWGER